jgi:glycosyltransferase involved in cell wall biosynthesis
MKVTVVVVTYNHARYIETALQSVHQQETDFDFEILISEDASTDGTTDIVRAWQARYPDCVRLILSSENVRSNQVVARAFAAARGDYIALLDGDDYWTSPYKLQQQVDMLDADNSLTLCFANADIVDQDGSSFGKLWTSPTLKQRLTLADLWDGNPFATCGSLFRRSAVAQIPHWYDGFFPVTDWPLYLLFAEQGDIAFLPQSMGAYRLHAGGLYSAQSRRAKLAAMDGLFRQLNQCFEGRYDTEIHAGHRRYFLDWTRAYLAEGEAELARCSLAYANAYRKSETLSERMEAVRLAARLLLRSGSRKSTVS